ncbi:hypothetical protein Ahy_A09g042167 isoform E [Arachis hypogaea]|uniref:Uncharacterized protein n=1 Tax=Arachis hypogaea TaxID=3818 RepID=A0A445BF01_ARAHY|nr:hypothetical protein Ahy_A09g042167 isoform E [Arachis hypogaea]
MVLRSTKNLVFHGRLACKQRSVSVSACTAATSLDTPEGSCHPSCRKLQLRKPPVPPVASPLGSSRPGTTSSWTCFSRTPMRRIRAEIRGGVASDLVESKIHRHEAVPATANNRPRDLHTTEGVVGQIQLLQGRQKEEPRFDDPLKCVITEFHHFQLVQTFKVREFALIAKSSKLGGNLGSPPVSLLKLRSILRRLVREFMDFGRNPEREFCERSSDWSDLRVVMEGGIEPEKELDRRDKVWSFEREEREEGIVP